MFFFRAFSGFGMHPNLGLSDARFCMFKGELKWNFVAGEYDEDKELRISL